MSLSSELGSNGTELTIFVEGRFDFSLQRLFREAYEKAPDDAVHYIVDLEKTTYLDSSALGMLLVLKEYAEGKNGSIKIAKPGKVVTEILQLSNFDKLFEVI